MHTPLVCKSAPSLDSAEEAEARTTLEWIRTKLEAHARQGFELSGGGVAVVPGLGLFAKSAARAYNRTDSKSSALVEIKAIADDLRGKTEATSGCCGWGARKKSTADLYQEIVEEIEHPSLSISK